MEMVSLPKELEALGEKIGFHLNGHEDLERPSGSLKRGGNPKKSVEEGHRFGKEWPKAREEKLDESTSREPNFLGGRKNLVRFYKYIWLGDKELRCSQS